MIWCRQGHRRLQGLIPGAKRCSDRQHLEGLICDSLMIRPSGRLVVFVEPAIEVASRRESDHAPVR
jgi:hypothetical protein